MKKKISSYLGFMMAVNPKFLLILFQLNDRFPGDYAFIHSCVVCNILMFDSKMHNFVYSSCFTITILSMGLLT